MLMPLRSTMIGLDADWDHDLCEETGAHAGTGAGSSSGGRAGSGARLRSMRAGVTGPAASLTLSSSSSKAKELLRRASEAAATSAASKEQTPRITGDMLIDSGAAVPIHDVVDAQATMDIDTVAVQSSKKSQGILGMAELPRSTHPSVKKCTSKAPRTMGKAFSFRASARGGLIALPVVQSERGGSFRVKLLRLSPSQLCQAQKKETTADLRNGVDLLEAHQDIGFGATAPADAMSTAILNVPPPIIPSCGHGPALLARYLERGKECLGTHSYESFELLSHLLGDTPEQDGASTAKLSHASQRLGVWLSQVNARTVKKHLAQAGEGAGISAATRTSNETAAQEANRVGHRLKAAFHCLTANSVRGALQEIGRASASAAEDEMQYRHFDRLSTILASCGGTARGGCVERRQWLRRQVLEWRSQGVDELMDTALWRLYSLLSGEVDSVAGDALDWRTTFGMYLWYRSADEKNVGIVQAVHDFEAICRKHGLNCSFRPAPPYLSAAPRRDPPGGDIAPLSFSSSTSSTGANASRDAEPLDLQFSTIRAALGLTDWSDFQQFDYMTSSPRPLDVASSWHFCLLLLVLSRPETENLGDMDAKALPAFQKLTQQYCLSLELSGNWEWAAYVALFITDARVRSRVIHGLLQRHSALSSNTGLALPPRPHWTSIPTAWVWRSEALRREKAWEWPGALACWLQGLVKTSGTSGKDMERAVGIALGFLLMPAILRHRSAGALPLRQSPTSAPSASGNMRSGLVELESATLAPMTAPLKWLAAALTELEPQLRQSQAGIDLLSFMRDWESNKAANCPPVRLAQLCNQCSTAKKRVLGIPW